MNNIRRLLVLISLSLLTACGGGGGGAGAGATAVAGTATGTAAGTGTATGTAMGTATGTATGTAAGASAGVSAGAGASDGANAGAGGSATPVSASPTTIGGVASKGLINNGTVTIFALNADGSKGAQLATGRTDANGAYSISIGSYAGSLIVEVYGSYTDEATGLAKSVPAAAPLRAALGSASGTVTLPVTPLTDLAVRQAGSALTPQKITAANALISDLFKIDIVNTVPSAPTAGAFQSSTTTQAQKDYALALAAIAQQMSSGSTLETTLATLNSGLSSTGMSPQTASAFTTAITDFIANSNNKTGVTSISETSLQNVGSTSIKLTVVLQGIAASVNGVQATITLPAGVSLSADSSGKPLTDTIKTTGSAVNGYLDSKYTPAAGAAPGLLTLGLITSKNLVAGDIIIINANLSAGGTAPAASAFALSATHLVDNNGNIVSGASLAIK